MAPESAPHAPIHTKKKEKEVGELTGHELVPEFTEQQVWGRDGAAAARNPSS